MNNSITKRWLIITVSVVAASLFIVALIFLIFTRFNYYETARITVNNPIQSSAIDTFFSNYKELPDELLVTLADDFLEQFSDSEKMEIWVINKQGNPIASSTGFEAQAGIMPDYDTAMNSDTRVGKWIGRNTNREKILAMTKMIPIPDSTENNGAIRYMVSLEDVDSQFRLISFIAVIVCAVVIGLVFFSGMFLIQSIVKPVKKINDTAKLIAKGNYNIMLPQHKYKDEIGELTSSFNAMARAISSADKLKNEFVSTVSHELRTPLTAIKGWGETLLGSNDPGLVQKGLEVIISETDRLGGIVEDLLDFSKMESGMLTLHLDMIDALAELDEAVFVFRDTAAREGIELSYNAPDELAPMNADANRIKQVFVNILDNAIKYTAQGGKIDITATVNGNLSIAISDNGCGIPSESLKYVKEKFFKANNSIRGSGIGLAVCDEIVKLHGGELNISSRLNVGTTVEIILPLTEIKDTKNN